MIYKLLLLIVSSLFIVIQDWRYIVCIFGYSLLIYLVGLWLSRKPNSKTAVAIGVFFSIAQIAVCRFADSIILPIGISFYSFSGISYLVDIYRNKIKADRSFINVALYLSFFPKLVAGPIVRYDVFTESLNKEKHLSVNNFTEGIQIATIGVFKKKVIADNLALFVNDVFYAPSAFNRFTIIFAVLSYSLQIYFDFSGYSDIAIGVTKILGFDFERNFDLPYISHNPTEFWKRWHISLSEWLKDYVYIPLGGNRKGQVITCLNLMITMVIGGLWHGLTWNFVIWGALNGFALVVHKLFKGNKDKTSGVAGIISTFCFITLTWIFFRADSLGNALDIIKYAAINGTGLNQPFLWTFVAIMVLAFEIIYSSRRTDNRKKVHYTYPIMDFTNIWQLAIFMTFIGITIILANLGNTAFIYGRF